MERPSGHDFPEELKGLDICQQLSFQIVCEFLVLLISVKFISGPQAATKNHLPSCSWSLPILSSTRKQVATETLWKWSTKAKCKRDEHFSLPKGWGASVLSEHLRLPPSISRELGMWSTDWGNSLASCTQHIHGTYMFSYMWHKLQSRKYTSYNKLRNFNCTCKNYEERKHPGSPNSM